MSDAAVQTPQPHAPHGERAAEHFGLPRAGKFASKELLAADRVRALTEAGTLREGRLYYFNARRGKQGHVGFVRLLPGGSEVRLGAAMSVVGGPFFLALLISMKRRLA